MQRKEEEGKKRMGQQALKQREAEEKVKEREAKREMIARKLEEKKKTEQKRMSQMAQLGPLEEDKKKVVNQQDQNMQLPYSKILAESKSGTHTTRRGESNNTRKQHPNLLQGSFKQNKPAAKFVGT